MAEQEKEKREVQGIERSELADLLEDGALQRAAGEGAARVDMKNERARAMLARVTTPSHITGKHNKV